MTMIMLHKHSNTDRGTSSEDEGLYMLREDTEDVIHASHLWSWYRDWHGSVCRSSCCEDQLVNCDGLRRLPNTIKESWKSVITTYEEWQACRLCDWTIAVVAAITTVNQRARTFKHWLPVAPCKYEDSHYAMNLLRWYIATKITPLYKFCLLSIARCWQWNRAAALLEMEIRNVF